MTLRLKSVIASLGLRQGDVADACGLARSTLNGLANHGRLPTGADRAAIETGLTRFVREQGGDIAALFAEEVTPPCSNTVASFPFPVVNEFQEAEMLLRKQVLSQAARKHFELPRDPFADPQNHEDVYLSADMRYVREAMWGVVKHGGFLAVIGESGAGKSTLREELLDRIQRDKQPVHVIAPYVLAMEDKDSKGKTLRSAHIAEAIMATIAPLEPVKSSPEARFRQLHSVLTESSRAGYRHLLLIEEAHSLPIPTLKHLKRFVELKDGLRSLVSVILVAQPELALKLNEHDPNVREVVQRIEIVTLPPLDADLEGYLKHRFERVGIPVARVFEGAAIDALRTRLTPADGAGTRGAGSMLYPLVIHNVLAAAMNTAAELMQPRVTAGTVRSV